MNCWRIPPPCACPNLDLPLGQPGAPVCEEDEDEILHHQYRVIDTHTTSDPVVILSSTHGSKNGNSANDENPLIGHDASIPDPLIQEFAARCYPASGE